MAQLFLDRVFIGTPGGILDFFQDNRTHDRVRVYTIQPINPTGFDQQAEITEVYSILKGFNHPGEAGDLQEHVVVQNKQGGAFDLHPDFLTCQVWMVEL